MEHNCEMKEEINELYHAIFGNGKPGLKTTVALLEQTTKENTEAMKDLRTAISGFDKYMNQSIGEIRHADKRRINSQWAIGISISALLLVVAVSGLYINAISK
jgi:uncharacterized protein YaaN involved in tellurite resistance